MRVFSVSGCPAFGMFLCILLLASCGGKDVSGGAPGEWGLEASAADDRHPSFMGDGGPDVSVLGNDDAFSSQDDARSDASIEVDGYQPSGSDANLDTPIDPDVSAASDATNQPPGIDSAEETEGARPCRVHQPVFVPIADRVDVVVDEERCRVYVSTNSGVVYRYDIDSQELAPLSEMGVPLKGIDLSPDHKMLVVADAQALSAPNPHSQVFLVDIPSGTWRTLSFPLQSLEAGTFMPLFIDNETFLLTSMFAGSGWVPFRRVKVSDGSFEELSTINQNTMLALSADGSTVAFAESNISSGPIGRYFLPDRSTQTVNSNAFVYEVAISRNASQYAVPLYLGLYVYNYDGSFGGPTVLGTPSEHYAVGAAYSPDSDVLYVAWTDVSGQHGSIEAMDSRSLASIFVLDADPGLDSNGNFAFVSGRLRMAKNGDFLVATVKAGVKIYPARQELAH